MYKKMKLILFLGLLIIMLSLFSGCYKDNNNIKTNDTEEVINIGPRPVFDIPEQVRPEALFSDLRSLFYKVAPYGTGLYIYSATIDNPEERIFYFCDVTDGSINPTNFVIPEDFQVWCYIALSENSLLVGGAPATYDDNNELLSVEETFRIYHLTENKTELLIQGEENTTLSGLTEMAVDTNRGHIYLNILNSTDGMWLHTLSVYSLTGEKIFNITSDDMIRDIVFSECDQKLYLINMSGNDLSIAVINEDLQIIEEVARLSGGAAGVMIHQSSNRGFIAEMWSKILEYDTSLNEFTELFDLSSQGISGWVSSLQMYDSYYIALVDDIATGMQGFIKFQLTKRYEGPVEVVSLGRFESGRDILLETLIAEFNFYNPQYLIEIKDYSVYGEEAATRLHLDIISGNAPDLLLLSEPRYFNVHLPIRQYTANNMLVNLAPYIDRDLNTDDIFDNVLKSFYTGNACYIAIPTFSLNAISGRSYSITEINSGDSNQLLDFLLMDLQSDDPKFSINTTREEFLIDFVFTNISYFVDYINHDAFFNSPLFIKLLEVTKELITEEERIVLRFTQGLQDIGFITYSDIVDLDIITMALHGDIETVGFPGDPPGAAVIPKHIFGISSGSKNIEGAWAFIHFIYQFEDIHNIPFPGFPINHSSYMKMINIHESSVKQMIGNNNIGLYIDVGHTVVTAPPLTGDQIDANIKTLYSMINNANVLSLYDHIIIDIIYEELPAFLSGSRSASNTARVINNRIQRSIWELS